MSKMKKSNAAFIVRAVNSHKELLSALMAVQEDMTDFGRVEPDTMQLVHVAIVKAGGK